MFDKSSIGRQGKMFNTLEVLAVAYAAHRINKGYIKFGSFDYHKNIVISRANKEIVKEHFVSWRKSGEDNLHRIQVLDSDKAQAANVRNHFKKYTLGLLGNSLNDFQQDLFQAVSADEVSSSELGILAYVPEMITREQTESNLKKVIKTDFADSQHIGAVGDKFQGECKIIAKHFHSMYERYIYTVVNQGNVLGFFCKFEFKEGENKIVNGKIKDLVYNTKLKVNETRLNYVKVTSV